jgi:pSer/pThr/pTyr-binding forkhead associated (FHA) protein
MLAIATNALYTTLCRRGTTRQLAWIIVLCVLAALMLLPAIFWYNLRFEIKQSALSFAEIEAMLGYIALCGWLMPLGMTTTYCLFSPPRSSTTALHIPRLKRTTKTDPVTVQKRPPRYQPGMVIPYVYREDTAWGWLEYRNGNFQGQRLELKRAIITIGRDEDNDIWIDDDLASRRHAELCWDEGQIYLTDCDSLNGVLLNGQRVRGFTPVEANDLLEVGAQSFIFMLADRKDAVNDANDDPLSKHTWRSSVELIDPGGDVSFASLPVTGNPQRDVEPQPAKQDGVKRSWNEMGELQLATPSHYPGRALLIKSGEETGKYFILDRPVLSVGRGFESDIIINDMSLSRQHAQFLCKTDGDYIQDLTSLSGTTLNNEAVMKPQMLKLGDAIHMGNIMLEYISMQNAQTIPLSQLISPRPFTGPISSVGPALLKLPSKRQ